MESKADILRRAYAEHIARIEQTVKNGASTEAPLPDMIELTPEQVKKEHFKNVVKAYKK